MADAAPTTPKEIFAAMPGRFNKDAAKGLNATYQFDLSGDNGGKWNVVINNETCTVNEGPAASPSITISMTAQDYVDMTTGKLNGQVAFMSGKLRIAGDMGLALRMQSLFA
ncbi:MAG: SCP2 sterol-binding domain-containing protein [Candidatus Binatus sp.]|jgi:putative sterol carrier protein|uniref:SCP2 sterol-binding domain-containing protein n=1 Tax=Candidatus Binatus sp. TaxID=2811406 RepID=UPI003C70B7A7